VLVRSPAAKERLLSYVSSGNHEKVRTAPMTEIVAYDREFFELSPRLYPHTDDPHSPVYDEFSTRRRDRSAQFVIAGRLFYLAIARPRSRLRTDVGVRRQQGRRGVLPQSPISRELSAEYRLRRAAG